VIAFYLQLAHLSQVEVFLCLADPQLPVKVHMIGDGRNELHLVVAVWTDTHVWVANSQE
jgi:hypothetical protein